MSNIDETIAEVLRLEAVASGRKVWEARMVCPRGGWSDDDDDDEFIGLDGWWIDGPEWLDYADSSFFRQADAALVAYYRTAAPALAREVRRLQGEIERLRLEHAEERLVSCCEGHNLGYDAAYRAGQEAMRERCAALVDRAADAACECDGTLCGPDDVAPHDEDCRRFDLDDLADAIRALEVER
jgi:hypothetical protein